MGRHRLASLGLVAVAVAAACTSDPTSPFGQRLDLQSAQKKWSDARLVNYSFNSTVLCFCLPEFTGTKRVTVRNGQVTAIVDVGTGASEPLTWRQPVDSIFKQVAEEIRQRPERLQVTYDDKLGYPRTLTYGTPENDGGGYITVDSVRPIP